MEILNEVAFYKYYPAYNFYTHHFKETIVNAWNAAIKSTQKPVKWKPSFELNTLDQRNKQDDDINKVLWIHQWLTEQEWNGEVQITQKDGNIAFEFYQTSKLRDIFFEKLNSGEIELSPKHDWE